MQTDAPFEVESETIIRRGEQKVVVAQLAARRPSGLKPASILVVLSAG
jgi:hypothetical protein